jgi:DNA polymerase III epsilon subunit family exonuclease
MVRAEPTAMSHGRLSVPTRNVGFVNERAGAPDNATMPARSGAPGWTPLPRSVRFAVIDVETTGLDPRSDRVVEVAVVQVDIDELGVVRIGAGWDSLVHPGRAVRAGFVHGIDDTMVTAAPRFRDVAPAVLDALAGRVVVAHNLAFDAAFLRAEFRRSGIAAPDPLRYGICTLTMARAALSGRHGLTACCASLGVIHEARHTALGDARATAAVLPRLLARVAYAVSLPFPSVPCQLSLIPVGAAYLASRSSPAAGIPPAG